MSSRSNKKLAIILLCYINIILIFSNTVFAEQIQTKSDSAITTAAPSVATVATDNSKIQLLSPASVLMDASSGQILYDHNSKTKMFPASTTKLMTAILAMENCKMTDIVTVDAKAPAAVPASYTKAPLQPGEKISVEELLHAVLIPSANDAANALAIHMAGSIEDFSVMMNTKAKEIGCTNTHFVNPSGIHDDNHYSTAYDMALIGKYAMKYNEITTIAQKTEYDFPNLPDGKPRHFKTTNTLITPKNKYYYENATGLKTGYTAKAKSCIVATAKKSDESLICVVLGGDKTPEGKAQRELDCKTLFEYGFNNFSKLTLCEKDSLINLKEVSNTPNVLKEKNIKYSEDIDILTPNKTQEKTETTVAWNENMNLPIKKDTQVGTVTYTINSKTYSTSLLAADDINPDPISNDTAQMFYFILIALLVIFIFLSFKRRKYKKKSRKDSKYFRHSIS